MKKRFTLILGSCALAFVLIIGGIIAEVRYFSQENNTNADKDSVYYDYIVSIAESAVKDNDEILNCEIAADYSNGELVTADVKVVTKNGEMSALKTNIRDYVSSALEISYENITISFE